MIRTQDETQILAEATAALSGNLQKVIGDADYLLGEMSEGNFALTSGCAEAYVGDFQGLLESIRKLNHKLSETLNEIKTAVGQVSLGANQMADAAQGLAEGATDQAGSVEELQATITNVTEIVEKNAKALGGSYQKAMDYQQQAKDSGEEMKGLTDAMQRINDTSRQISDIIGEIEDIASQTNLLSLNAAIEAARAGDAGRGFAVVATEIGGLAEQSKEAVVKIQQVTEAVTSSVERLSGDTQQLLEFVGGDVVAAYDMFDKVADAYNQDAKYIDMLIGDFSATSEELLASIDGVLSSMDGIATATNEGAKGTTDIAQRTIDVKAEADQVTGEVSRCDETARKLSEEIAAFKVD